jgi:CheY-like chemotaxis protein
MKKILLVSSSSPFLERNRHLLSRTNFTIITATSGHEALLLHEKEKFNLIVTELNIDDMGGEHLCDLVRRSSVAPDVPIILIYHNLPEDMERARRSSADILVTKPIIPENFLKVVGEQLDIQMIRHKRVELNLNVLTQKDKIAFTCVSHNISTLGILIETDNHLDHGDRLNCSFILPNGGEITVEGEVVRSVRMMTGGYQYGIRFMNLPIEHRRDIEGYVSEFATKNS